METNNLLNIKPKVSMNSNTASEQAKATDSSDPNKADSFKSELKTQIDQNRNEEVLVDKKLPQDGNKLPKQETAIEQQDKKPQSFIKEIVSSELNDELAQQTNEKPALDTIPVVNLPQPYSSASDESSEPMPQVTEQTLEQLTQVLSDVRPNPLNGSFAQVASSTPAQITPAAIPVTIPVTMVGTTDKFIAKKQEVSTQTHSLNTSLESGKLNSPINQTIEVSPLKGNESKNNSPLSQNTVDFQQYLEMSKKHAMAGEVTHSMKSFKENLKTDPGNAQLIHNEVKLPINQNSQVLQTAMQSTSLEKMNTVLNSTTVSGQPTMTSLEVKIPVGKTGWSQGFSNQITLMANQGLQEAKIKLNPRHLGPVEASVKLMGETAVVNLSSLHMTTKEAMENALPRLKEMLNENGFSQVDVNVSHQDKKEQQDAQSGTKTGSNSEHGNSTMPGEEQLSEITQDSDPLAQAKENDEQGLNIVDYYA